MKELLKMIIIKSSSYPLWLGLEALDRSPRFDQRAIHGEVLMGNQLLPLGEREDFAEELPHDRFRKQPLAVLGETRRRPNFFVHGQTDKPAI